jgi:hypothetical protein
MIKRSDIRRINSPSPRLDWCEWFKGYMMRGECEVIMWRGDKLSLHVFHVGNNWAKKERVFWVLKEKKYYYEMNPESFNQKGEKDFLLPWDLIDALKKKVIEDLVNRELLAGSKI